jgi:hypothetical protein
MRPLPDALRRAALIGLAAGLLGGLVATVCLPAPATACARPGADAPTEIPER